MNIITRKKDFNSIIEYFHKYNCILHTVEEEYKNNKTLLHFTCNKHKNENVQTRTWSSITVSKNAICNYCIKEEKYNKLTTSINDIIDIFAKHNCTLVEIKIKRKLKDEIEFTCNKHPNVIQTITADAAKYYKNICKECQSIAISGENAMFWKDGRTPENKLFRDSKPYLEWRQKVFQRDNFTCQCCNKKGGRINAHHIQSFAHNKDLRIEISNGITLCESHHMPTVKDSFHNVYGSYNNTQEQLQEYFNDIRTKLCLPLVDIEDIVNRNS